MWVGSSIDVYSDGDAWIWWKSSDEWKYGINLILQLLIFVLKRIDRRMGKRAQRKMDIHAI